MHNIMIDIETLGIRPGSVILSIGAVAFCPETGELGEAFYNVISTVSCILAEMRIDPETEKWWSEQSEEVRKTIELAEDESAPPLYVVLKGLNDYLKKFPEKTCIWGNGPDFDQALLNEAYHRAGIEPRWKFWNFRCFRTLKALAPQIKMERTGTYHNALHDAETQARHAIKVLQHLKGAAQHG